MSLLPVDLAVVGDFTVVAAGSAAVVFTAVEASVVADLAGVDSMEVAAGSAGAASRKGQADLAVDSDRPTHHVRLVAAGLIATVVLVECRGRTDRM
jgi:hypothetical protein